MNTGMMSGLSSLELLLVTIHWAFMFLAITGGIMLAIWMFKNMKAKQLLVWIIGAIVIGLLGSLLTFQSEIKFLSALHGEKAGMMNMMK